MNLKDIKTKDLQFSEEGVLILKKNWKDVGIKILDSHIHAKNRMKDAVKEGKHILVLPGSYDLLHGGHILWFEQAISHFLQTVKREKGTKVSRKDVYVVTPIDNDSLVRVEKRLKYKAFGGKENILRPIVTQDMRSLALANLDFIDLVFPVPSPLDIDKVLKQPKYFSIEKARTLLTIKRQNGVFSDSDYYYLKSGLDLYNSISKSKSLDDVGEIFSRLSIPKVYIDQAIEKSRTKDWHEISWQLMWHLYLSDNAHYKLPSVKNVIHRVISKRDKYSEEAKFLIRLTGISVDSMMDDYITSTTEIISKYIRTQNDVKRILESTNMISL